MQTSGQRLPRDLYTTPLLLLDSRLERWSDFADRYKLGELSHLSTILARVIMQSRDQKSMYHVQKPC